MNYRNRFWQHFESDIIWEHYFNGYPALMLDQCYNKEGYTVKFCDKNKYEMVGLNEKQKYISLQSSIRSTSQNVTAYKSLIITMYNI
jgi:hypothetical protein